MICEVEQAMGFNTYLLKSKYGQYTQTIELYGIDGLEVGNRIKINSKLLDPKNINYTQPYAFELVDTEQVKQINKGNEIEYIGVEKNTGKYLFKRIYG